jgi:hypothetical protein
MLYVALEVCSDQINLSLKAVIFAVLGKHILVFAGNCTQGSQRYLNEVVLREKQATST